MGSLIKILITIAIVFAILYVAVKIGNFVFFTMFLGFKVIAGLVVIVIATLIIYTVYKRFFD